MRATGLRLPRTENYASSSSPLERRVRRISHLEKREEARKFIEDYTLETNGTRRGFQTRWADVLRQLRRTGTYVHTPEELAFGARVAWRNHGRCIGRLFWESLEVFDCRHVTEPAEIADHAERHMKTALSDGRVRSLMTIFAPIVDGTMPAYIESEQITQYAGYVAPSGIVLGDRHNVEATRIAQSLGWRPSGDPSRFDILPFVVRDRQDRRHIFQLSPASFREVPIHHPESTEVHQLGLRWYAVPCVSGLILTIGGIDYPCAPFNGFYMATEIASRNLVDKTRYDLLPEIGKALGLDTGEKSSAIWKDVALTEINRAVMHSYRTAGVTMIDHHSASEQFMDFHRREQARGRRVAADWRWIVPPQASAACEVFHLKMRNFHPVPNFYSARTEDGRWLMPFYGDRHQNRLERSLDRVLRRWKLWKRMAW